MRVRRTVAALLATMVLTVLMGPPASAQPAAPAAASSAMTMSGKDEFAKLQVTVSQTTNLINQVVNVSWKGGVPTVGPPGLFYTDFLQVMQCWGDDPGPDRTQCQFGADLSSGQGSFIGNFADSRQVYYGDNLVDPNEPIKHDSTLKDPINEHVPFWPVDHDKPAAPTASDTNPYFGSLSTNEVSVARTRPDGTGQAYFEIQTAQQAAGLGCGEVLPSATTGRKCWLVIVPRGETEVNGVKVGNRLDSSPLSQTNWKNHIAFPLQFVPIGRTCPIGAPERRLIGHELATDAVSRWQPALCGGGGALFSYSQLNDDVTRNQVVAGSSPGLALVTDPIPPDQSPSDAPPIYAPVGLSGLAIAFNVEAQLPADAPAADLNLDGRRFPSMKLNARLVAKLLTQSYQGAVESGSVAGTLGYLPGNAPWLTVDPEFLTLNPEYKYLGYQAAVNRPADALVQLGNSDLTSLLWTWVKSDPDASAFITGTPDASGMVVNPHNKGLALPVSSYPRNDQTCAPVNVGLGVTGQACTGDTHPFTNDMHDAGLSASRGDTQARSLVVDGTQAVPKRVNRQALGHRALLAVVDTATAARYNLPTALLQNSAKQFVAPTTKSLLAGEAAMKPSNVPGVLAPNPTATDPAAYPLTALSYAVTQPTKLDAAAGKDYSAFLTYAASKGQEPGVAPGQLPFGMAPLPDALKAQTIAAAATIKAQAGKPPPGAATPTPAATPAPVAPNRPDSTNNGGTGTNATTPGSRAATPSGTPALPQATGSPTAPSATAPAATPAAVGSPQSVAEVRRTPSLPAQSAGALIVALLVCGGLAAMSSLTLQRLAARTAPFGKEGEADRPPGRASPRPLARLSLLARRQ